MDSAKTYVDALLVRLLSKVSIGKRKFCVSSVQGISSNTLQFIRHNVTERNGDCDKMGGKFEILHIEGTGWMWLRKI